VIHIRPSSTGALTSLALSLSWWVLGRIRAGRWRGQQLVGAERPCPATGAGGAYLEVDSTRLLVVQLRYLAGYAGAPAFRALRVWPKRGTDPLKDSRVSARHALLSCERGTSRRSSSAIDDRRSRSPPQVTASMPSSADGDSMRIALYPTRRTSSVRHELLAVAACGDHSRARHCANWIADRAPSLSELTLLQVRRESLKTVGIVLEDLGVRRGLERVRLVGLEEAPCPS
jgi:hypothetical protein